MKLSIVPNDVWSRLSEFIADKMGLHFPPERYADLERGLVGAAEEFGFTDAGACADWLLNEPLTKAQLQALASHLTVGETYFFREKKTFEVLAESALPELMRLRRNGGRRLRLWSAACCTGEEPYSLAILLHQSIPDLANWHVMILATDINERFLQKAAAGVFGKWSFRESPPWFKERYFRLAGVGRYEILPEIKKMVTFANLNLVEDNYPALATDTNAMDVIFCRNVLMYFTLPQAAKTVRKLRCALVDDGWLAVSPCEASQTLFSRFAPANLRGAILYQKSNAKVQTMPSWTPLVLSESTPFAMPEGPVTFTPENSAEEPAAAAAPPTPAAIAASLYERGHYAEAVDTLLTSIAKCDEADAKPFSLLARALANQGKLADALCWCDRWIGVDKLDASGHYLRAVVLQELGEHEQSRRSLQRATYLHPDFVLAHFALGNLARARGRSDEADKHFTNAAHLLEGCPPDDFVPESDGMTVGRLTEIISSVTALGIAP